MADDNQQQPNFDFIMKQEPKPQSSFKLPANIPKPVFFVGIGVVLLIIIIIIGSILGGSGNSTDIYKLMSDAATIENASDDAANTAVNTDTKTIASTAKQTMSSQEQQLKAYLKARKIKYDAKQVHSALDSTTAAGLKNAQANNTYDAAYLNYLRTALNNYQTDLQFVYKKSGPSLKAITADAYSSNSVILKSKSLQ